MEKFGVIKDKLINVLLEEYETKNKRGIQKTFSLLNQNKDFKELYLFYEEIEEKVIEDENEAKLYLEEVLNILKTKSSKINEYMKPLSKKLKKVVVKKNQLYDDIDTLIEENTLSNITEKISAKKRILEHLMKPKVIEESLDLDFTPNEALLRTILTNNFNSKFENELNESEKEEFKVIVGMDLENLKENFLSLKEDVLNTVGNLLTESEDNDLKSKLDEVKNEVDGLTITRMNYVKLKTLKNNL